ncbi:nicotinate-nucleotide--dimethylbenzimidazole phosphoribosyltransferase [Nakamurella antarctica]|uniref:nicotinate-nucleotide--dimethylbenzimidazole phosphoribosyltransferase n=1 Tax=Nakamurella antarctica TaxID=1902245 RepID=UPI001EEFC622|nr:nicotinate-nucleotide--dimethylbenzimidazole phosphoribosyltransferase [Nakamurella antarctica]
MTSSWAVPAIDRPSAQAAKAARTRIDALAKPLGALGDLEGIAVWLAGCQDHNPPTAPHQARAVVFAGDHGISQFGVSAYPREVTPAMVRTIAAGKAGISVLCAANDIALRVLDVAVDDDLDGVDPAIVVHKVRRSSGPIHLENACSTSEIVLALEVGAKVALEEIAAGADLLIVGDLGIGNTTVAATLIAALLELPAAQVVGRGTGIDDAALAAKSVLINQALERVSDHDLTPIELLAAVGSADIAAGVGFMLTAAACRVPVLLDGIVSVAEALVAQAFSANCVAWFAAGHRSTEPAQQLALEALELQPLLDLKMRLGEGTGAVAAVPLVRAAARLAGDMALLADLAP